MKYRKIAHFKTRIMRKIAVFKSADFCRIKLFEDVCLPDCLRFQSHESGNGLAFRLSNSRKELR